MTFEEHLQQAKSSNLGQILLRCSRLFNERAIQRLQAQYPGIRVSHTSLLPHLDLEGTRLVELARRTGISKQAVGQLVQEMEQLGLLSRHPDPCDRRAFRICFSASGRKALLEGLGLLRSLQQEMEAALGEERIKRLVDDLQSLQDYLETNLDGQMDFRK